MKINIFLGFLVFVLISTLAVYFYNNTLPSHINEIRGMVPEKDFIVLKELERRYCEVCLSVSAHENRPAAELGERLKKRNKILREIETERKLIFKNKIYNGDFWTWHKENIIWICRESSKRFLFMETGKRCLQ